MVKKKLSVITTIIILIAGISSSSASDKGPDIINFGSVAMDTPAQMDIRLKPLISYLSKKLHRPVVLKLSADMTSAINQLVSAEVHLAYLTPVAYVNSRKKSNTQLIVKTLNDNNSSFRLAIIAHESSKIKTIDDLANKKFAFGDQAALLQRAVVINAGMQLQNLSEYKFLGHYDNIVRAILHGDFNAGIVTEATALRWKNKGIKIIYLSEQLPPYNITANENLADDVKVKIREALLQLNSDNIEHRAVLGSLDKSNTGFAIANDSDYDIVRTLIEPFQTPGAIK